MSEIQIDHDRMKKSAEYFVCFPKTYALASDISRAYLDLQQQLASRDQEITDQANKMQSEIGMLQLREKQLEQQLAAERARVQKLAELVEHAYDEGYKAHVRLKDSQWPDTYQCSDVKDQLAAILNAQETPHA